MYITISIIKLIKLQIYINHQPQSALKLPYRVFWNSKISLQWFWKWLIQSHFATWNIKMWSNPAYSSISAQTLYPSRDGSLCSLFKWYNPSLYHPSSLSHTHTHSFTLTFTPSLHLCSLIVEFNVTHPRNQMCSGYWIISGT